MRKAANKIADKLKAPVRKGNATHIRIRENDTIIPNLPVTVGAAGTIPGAAAAPPVGPHRRDLRGWLELHGRGGEEGRKRNRDPWKRKLKEEEKQ